MLNTWIERAANGSPIMFIAFQFVVAFSYAFAHMMTNTERKLHMLAIMLMMVLVYTGVKNASYLYRRVRMLVLLGTLPILLVVLLGDVFVMGKAVGHLFPPDCDVSVTAQVIR
jgi:membrane-associated HD superfamily phosphohydrolase